MPTGLLACRLVDGLPMNYDRYRETKFSTSRFDGINAPVPSGIRCVCVYIPDSDDAAGLLASILALPTRETNWEGAPEQRFIHAQAWLEGYLMTNFGGCFDCDALTACLQPLFDAVNLNIANVAAELANVAQDVADIDNRVDTLNIQNNARQPDPVTVSGCDEPSIFSGAIYLVQRMNQFIIDVFQQAEAAAADNQQEYLAILFEAIPGLETLPVDELWELSNWYFQNQQAQYEADYTLTFEEAAACELYCLILANDCTLNTTIIGDWLSGIIAAIPNSRAAEIYGRFAPSAQTFASQVNALVQGAQSLQSFFDDLHRQYAVGVLNQYPVPPACGCSNCSIYDFLLSPDEWALDAVGGVVYGTYVSGTGFRGKDTSAGGTNPVLWVRNDFDGQGSVVISSMSVNVDFSGFGSQQTIEIRTGTNGENLIAAQTFTGSGVKTLTWSGSLTTDAVWWRAYSLGAGTNTSSFALVGGEVCYG